MATWKRPGRKPRPTGGIPLDTERRLLRYLHLPERADGAPSYAEMARAVKLRSVEHVLTGLERRGYVERTAWKRGWRVTPAGAKILAVLAQAEAGQ